MTTYSPLLQSMISQSNAGITAPAINSAPVIQKAPAVQNAPTPVIPKIQTENDSVEINAKEKKKSSLAKRLLKGAGIGAGVGFAGGTGFSALESRMLKAVSESAECEDITDTVLNIVKKIIKEKDLNEVLGFATDTINANKARYSANNFASNFMLFCSDFFKQHKFAIGSIAAAGCAVIGLGIGAIVHCAKKSKEK